MRMKPKSKPTRPSKPARPKKLTRKRIRLLPVMDPRFNAREIVKQSWMLEDHLTTPQKNCCDCIKKHFLALEGLAEEAAALECRKYTCPPLLKTYASKVRAMHHAFEHAPKSQRANVMLVIGRHLRQLRKKLMKDGVALPLRHLPDPERARVTAIHKEAATLTKKTKTPRRRS